MELFAPQGREIFVEVRIPTVQLIKRLRRTVSKEQPVHKNPAVLVLYVQVGSYYAYFSILFYGLYTKSRAQRLLTVQVVFQGRMGKHTVFHLIHKKKDLAA